jgi:hypothetical protein
VPSERPARRRRRDGDLVRPRAAGARRRHRAAGALHLLAGPHDDRAVPAAVRHGPHGGRRDRGHRDRDRHRRRLPRRHRHLDPAGTARRPHRPPARPARGAVATAAAYVPLAFVTEAWQLVALYALTGATIGGVLPSISAMLAQLTDRGEAGSVYGIDNAVVSAPAARRRSWAAWSSARGRRAASRSASTSAWCSSWRRACSRSPPCCGVARPAPARRDPRSHRPQATARPIPR